MAQNGRMSLIVAARREEAEGIISLDLARPDYGALPPFEAGAHVELELSSGLVRHYSLSNDPTESRRYRLAVLREPKSRGGSSAVHDDLQMGAEVLASPPRNNFGLVPAARRSVLIAAGIGITPVLSMAYALARAGADFELHYCTRNRARAAFLAELASAPFADRVHRWHDDSVEVEARFEADGALGRPEPGAHVYVCGPGGFMDYVLSRAEALGWPAAQLHVERFSATVTTAGDAFEVIARDSGVTVRVGPDQTIAEALIAAGIDVPMSCEQGVCGTCVTTVVDGTPDHRDMYLSDDERAANDQMAVCCSRALSATLTLAI